MSVLVVGEHCRHEGIGGRLIDAMFRHSGVVRLDLVTDARAISTVRGQTLLSKDSGCTGRQGTDDAVSSCGRGSAIAQ
jgi:hypothetical protein